MVHSETNNMRRQLRVGRHDSRMQKMLHEKVVLAANNNIQHENQNKQGNAGIGNDTRQNVAENIQRTSINSILGVTD